MSRVSHSPLAYFGEMFRHPRAITLRARSRARGDNLLLSCPAREIKKQNPKQHVIIETRWPELFADNPHVDAVLTRHVSPRYHKIRYFIDPGQGEHMIDQIIQRLPISIPEWERKVDLFLSPESRFEDGKLPAVFIVINPVGKGKHSANRKEWGFENFVSLRAALSEVAFVQIGDAETPLLPRTADYRGRSILESAAIIQRARTGVFLEGGLMHVANAVDRPSVIVYGGAVSPEVSGYSMHRNLHTSPDCGPCFTSDQPMAACETMVCMQSIPVDRVVAAVRSFLD